MASKYRRRRRNSVRGRPNLVWLTIADQFELVSDGNGVIGAKSELLLPEDWQTLNSIEDQPTQLLHIVHHHVAYGVAVGANFAWSSLWGIFISNDQYIQNVNTHVPNIGDGLGFINTFDQLDQCLHWGSYTVMPYAAGPLAAGVHVAGGSMASMPENMVNLNVKRNLKGDDCVIAVFGAGEPTALEIWNCFSFTRCLVRIGLK